MTMNRERQQESGSHAGRWVLWGMLALLAYFLSWGPASATCLTTYERTVRGPQAAVYDVVYAPMNYAVWKCGRWHVSRSPMSGGGSSFTACGFRITKRPPVPCDYKTAP
jgi:hypothetical protein